MSRLEGLLFYEIVLLACGVLLFGVLIWVLMHRVKKGEPVKTVLGGFTIPIVMIGFPGIKKFEYEDGKFTIEKATDPKRTEPLTAEEKQKLEQAVEHVESRAAASPAATPGETLVVLSEGRQALGQYQQAIDLAEQVLSTKGGNAKTRRDAADVLVRAESQLSDDGDKQFKFDGQRKQALKKAVNVLEKAKTEISPETEAALIEGMQRIGREKDAARRFEELEKQNPRAINSRLKERMTNSRSPDR